ncbi:hypothetical protein U8V72_17550 [Priestia filamentosa]|uniref:hypothetical protein n=1 Tax=Priestia filamentosa TaxID=1402861 RepID=UPI000A66D875
MLIPIVLICYLLFFKPEVVFKDKCPDKPYSLEVVTYGTGFFDYKIAFIHYKIGGKTVAKKQLVFFENFSRHVTVVWDTYTAEGIPVKDTHAHLTMQYAKNFQGDLDYKLVDFDYGSVKNK